MAVITGTTSNDDLLGTSEADSITGLAGMTFSTAVVVVRIRLSIRATPATTASDGATAN